MKFPIVAIVGRPNVGKSTLFNRLAGRRMAIVFETPGTTRDRVAAPVLWEGASFILVDTGGLDLETQDDLWTQIRRQAQMAISDADVILLVTDASVGLQPSDQEVANLLRRQQKPVVLAVNKADNERQALGASEFYRLGLGDPLPVSAIHNQGVADLMERVLKLLPHPEPQGEEPAPVPKLAFIGRPNVGKSSLLNTILGEERALVHEKPGTTRDALDTPWTHKNQPLLLIDTAGIRRRGRIEPGVERYSALRAFQAIERCDVALLLLDATDLLTAQDLHIAGYVVESFKGLALVVNKWDLAREHRLDEATVLPRVRTQMNWATYVPVRFASALTGEGVGEVLDVALEVYRERAKQVDQRELSRLLLSVLADHTPPSRGKRHLRIYRVAQSGVHPPTFTFYVNNPELVHFSYQRFLENALRKAFGFKGNHLKLRFSTSRGVKV